MTRISLKSLCIAALTFVSACGVEEGRQQTKLEKSTDPLCGVVVDKTRSLFVTDATALGRFDFQRTMDQLIATGDVTTGQTSLNLFQQWWDTQNSDATGVFTGTRHCDDSNPNMNGFPIECPRAEGALASANPFVAGPNHFSPVAIVNRFDLAPSDGAHCGEYRIVYAKDSGLTNIFDRNFIIFEAALPNPTPKAGIEGCRPVAEFWALLSSDNDATSRANKLESFYYTGLTGFRPVVHAEHYGMGAVVGGYGGPAGQIRTNQFMQQFWDLREFKLARVCRSLVRLNALAQPEPLPIEPITSCSLVMNHVTVKGNPFGPLFSLSGPPESAAFQTEFVTNLGSLLATNVNGIGLVSGQEFNAGDSFSQGSQNNYRSQAATNAALHANITAALPAGSGLTSTNVLDRATTQSCAGCHQLSNNVNLGGGVTWPASGGFVHVNESRVISSALDTVFLPARKAVLEDFVNTCVIRKVTALPSITISGKLVGAAN